MPQIPDYWKNPPDEHTKVKSQIVVEYFFVWAKIIGKTANNLTYLDLFSGRGAHESGDFSTALQITQKAGRDDELKNKLRIILNDMDTSFITHAKQIVKERKLNSGFKSPIQFENFEVDKLTASWVRDNCSGAKFCFIDPYGFKGVSVDLIKSAIKEWGCDCIVFFSTSGVVRDVKHPQCINYMKDLFGATRYQSVLNRIDFKKESRMDIIVDEFIKACNEIEVKYVLPFSIWKKASNYHLVLLSKHQRGFERIKNIYVKYSKSQAGLPLYEYIEDDDNDLQLDLYMSQELDKLTGHIIELIGDTENFVKDIVEAYHRKGYIYPTKSVKMILHQLEEKNRIIVKPPAGKKRQKGTMGDGNFVSLSR